MARSHFKPTAFSRWEDVRKQPPLAGAEVCEVRTRLTKRYVVRARFLVRLADAEAIVLPEAHRTDLPVAGIETEMIATRTLT